MDAAAEALAEAGPIRYAVTHAGGEQQLLRGDQAAGACRRDERGGPLLVRGDGDDLVLVDGHVIAARAARGPSP